jgi:Phosphate-induced protein 1 conserved region
MISVNGERFRGLAVQTVATVLLSLLLASGAQAETARNASHLVPTGKGWGVEQSNSPFAVVTGNGINYHGGPIMPGTVNVYFIWYGNWSGSGSNSSNTVGLLSDLFALTGGISDSGYENINTTYGDTNFNVTGIIGLASSASSIFDNYSQGTKLSDSKVRAVVSRALTLTSGKLPTDPNGVYFVLTSSDVAETSGFCSRYCGWHTKANLSGTDIKYSFVGNPDRCPSACEMQTISPNGDSGADGMASVMAHEAEEALTDPDLNAWYDSNGQENADKCAWKFGPPLANTIIGNGAYNQTFGSHNWLIQMNWENARGGGCDQKLGDTFYTK